jgi:hypothetical protein
MRMNATQAMRVQEDGVIVLYFTVASAVRARASSDTPGQSTRPHYE